MSQSDNPERSPAKDGRKALGQWGEERAAAYLSGSGLTIMERNWRARSGEIDIIAQDGETIVFVEVRTRRPGGRFGTAEESVDLRKQRQVRETAQIYLHAARKHGLPCRFDVIAVTAEGQYGGAAAPVLKHIAGAF
ncbi:MAG: YraN family protein [Paenibacillaceae bacterium]|jgi:putative endonuclease|nr:YraN family protein [Paenibacillaceae bacterium]